MKTLRHTVVLFAASAIATVAAADTIRLRGSVRLDARATQVRLADIAEIEGPEAVRLGTVVVGTIGDPSKALEIRVADVRERLDAAGANWALVNLSGRTATVRPRLSEGSSEPRAMEGLSIATATDPAEPDTGASAPPAPRNAVEPVFASAIADPTSVRGTIAAIIANELSVGPERLRMTFDSPEPALLDRLPDGARAEVELLGNCTSERVAFNLRLWIDGKVARTVAVGVRPEVQVELARAVRDLRRGSSIGDDDLATEATWASPPQLAALLHRSEAVGRVALRDIQAGASVDRREIEPVEVVDRGDHVFVRVVIGRHAIKVEAEALQAGAIGDRIMLRRIGAGARRDRQPFPATVSGAGEAVIEGEELIVAAGA